MKRSPKGLYDFQPADGVTALKQVDNFVVGVEEWAKSVLDESRIKVEPRDALRLADQREHADEIYFALLVLSKGEQLRTALSVASTRGDETQMQSQWCAFRMMQFCGTAYAGAIVANETPLFAGIRSAEGGRKGGERSRRATPEQIAHIRATLKAVPYGQRGTTCQKLARTMRLGKRRKSVV